MIREAIRRAALPAVALAILSAAPAVASAETADEFIARINREFADIWLEMNAAGLRLIERNYRTPGRGGGEIDLVMRAPDGTLVFVEVRARASAAHGGAAASVGAVKQRRLVLAARHYLLRFRQPPPCRFDVVALDGDRVEWLRAAGAQALIHGHTHLPADHVLAPGLARHVLTDWDLDAHPPRAGVLRLTAEGLQRLPLVPT